MQHCIVCLHSVSPTEALEVQRQEKSDFEEQLVEEGQRAAEAIEKSTREQAKALGEAHAATASLQARLQELEGDETATKSALQQYQENADKMKGLCCVTLSSRMCASFMWLC
jgi:vacuolar-type H+-ATPase subunit E/Vma4